MPSGLRGFFYGTLGLSALYVLLAASSTKDGGDRVTGLFALPADFLGRVIDPTVPALHRRGDPPQHGGGNLPGLSILKDVLRGLLPLSPFGL